MADRAVLLSEASSLTAREFATVLGRRGVRVEAVSAAVAPITRFSRWCRAVHRVPAASADPAGYLRAVDELMATGRFAALLPTHEQAWLFAAGRRFLPRSAVAVADIAAFDQVASKLAFARLLDELGLPQPRWREVHAPGELGALGYPVWLKAAYSTAGRGVRLARDLDAAVAAWSELSAGKMPVMIQQSASGIYAQVQGIFDRGRLIAAAVSEQLATGAGGSAAARLSVDHPIAVAALERLGGNLSWHGGIALDYLHRDGEPSFIECNPRTVEPGNAAAAGVDLPHLMIELTSGGRDLPPGVQVTRPGVRTRSAMAMALGAAERRNTRRAVLGAVFSAALSRPPLGSSTEVLTPVLRDPLSVIPFAVTVGSVLLRPASAAGLARGAVSAYQITAEAVNRVREVR